MRTPTSTDEERLAAARARLPQFVNDAHRACHWLLETTDPTEAPQWLARLELSLPVVGKLFANEDLPPEEQREWLFPISALLGEYLRQRLGAEWVVDEAPTSHSFARPIVQWQHNDRELHRFDVMGRAADFLAQPAPRDLAGLVLKSSSGRCGV